MQQLLSRLSSRRRLFFVALVVVIGLGTLAVDHHRRWEIWLQITGVPKMDNIPVNSAGYSIELLPFYFRSSFARGHEVYFADGEGRVYKADDRNSPSAIVQLGNSQIPPRMLFVSSRGAIFISGNNLPMVRSVDGGRTWEKSHDWSFWRMTEDEASHTLYAGNYSPQKHPVYMAKVFKSTDEGKTWLTVFANDQLDHIHSILWDAKYNRLYMSAGDSRRRGQAYSQDSGVTWHWINSGGKQGHTDLAISDHYVLWGSDDNLGRVIRAPRSPVQDGKTIVWEPYHHVWWLVAENRQIYAGTLTGEGKKKYTGAFLLASADEGKTWQKLLEDTDGGVALSVFNAESRRLSTDGWLYCVTDSGKAYRIRHMPNVAGAALPN